MSYEAKVKIALDVPCSYFKSMKPFKRNLLFWQISNVRDNPELISAIDEALGVPKDNLETRQDESKQIGTAENVPKDIREEWQQIKKHSKSNLFCFYFRKGFRHPMLKGKEVYAYTFFDLLDMTRKIGSNTIEGYFLEPPLNYYLPPTKEQWMDYHLKILRDEGRLKGDEDVARYSKILSKQYKRSVSKKKFLSLLWIPTWTRQGYLQVIQGTQKAGKFAEVIFHAETELSPKIAKVTFLEAKAVADTRTIENLEEEAMKAHTELSQKTSDLEEAERHLMEAKRPVRYERVGRPELKVTTVPESTTGKLSRLFADLDSALMVLIGIWFAAMIFVAYGIEEYTHDTIRWDLMATGLLLFVCGLVLFIMRMRGKQPKMPKVPLTQTAPPAEGAEE